ncbi:MAG: threonine--tRNA ligase [Acidobacteria bacterium]|nr:threonine--tRNA ligase [Acidobacteriota bacterium]
MPDGSTKTYDQPVPAKKVAEDIGPGLAKQSIGVRINGVLRDLASVIKEDSKVQFVLEKPKQGKPDADALFLLRHTAAHVMAEAIQELWPRAQLVYGPPTDDGFFYDIRFQEGETISSKDFEQIEQRMAAIVAADKPMTRYVMPEKEALAKLEREGNKYKVDNAVRALEGSNGNSGKGKRQKPPISFYATGKPGEDWEDLCSGPHLPSTGHIKAFKVMSLASSYWHGDENSDRLTRVYGTAFFDPSELEKHLNRLEEARERDHRVIGKRLHLFLLDEMVGPGLVLWTPAGAVIRQELQNFISAELRKQGYLQVFTPHIGKLELYRTSGHFPYYADSQYPPFVERETLSKLATEGTSCAELVNHLGSGDIEGYLLKPMNCPHHIRIFASQRYSYRELPIRLAEFGTVYRWEQSGELSGMIRVRGFTQDDAHLFCTEEQVGQELNGCLTLVSTIFKTLNMTDYRVRVGLRDPDSSKYVGRPEVWEKAEQACRQAASTLGIPFSDEPGEAAFYGPKIDFVVKDVLGREWQLGTIQVDYNLPERFNLGYVGPDNQLHRPVIIHRAPFGAMERFCGVLIEHFAGAFPVWLSPIQAKVIPIAERHQEAARELAALLRDHDIRVEVDARNEKINLKIREAQLQKVPYMLVLGDREVANGTVSVRTRKLGDQGSLSREALLARIREAIQSRQVEG